MKPKLTQEQKLSWKITQQLGQAIEILQYNGIQLAAFLHEQAKENPFIEIETHMDDATRFSSSGNRLNFNEDIFINGNQNIYDYLKGQLVHIHTSEQVKKYAEYGIDSLDENGYLTVTLEEWAASVRSTISEVENALSIIQSLDPAGIGARTLQECIFLQLERREPKNEIAINLVENHIDWIADNELNIIANEYDITVQEAEKCIKEIQSCHPKPGIFITHNISDYIIPDVEVHNEYGVWKIVLSSLNKPTILLNDDFEKWQGLESEDKKFVQKYASHGQWLKKAVHQRYESLEKIFSKVVERQQPFFKHGEKMIKPLTLKDIAEDVHLHISTVSRAVKGKYMQTPHGIFPVKFFFQQGLATSSGISMSAHTIKALIKEIVDHEEKEKPFSDQDISDQLQNNFQIQISRRTVAKYRISLKIPTSAKRKRRF